MALSQHQDWEKRWMSPCSTEELVTLEQWIVQSRCRLVAPLGMGGIGKTSLSVKLAEQIQGEFEYLISCSCMLHLLNTFGRTAPILSDQKLTSKKTQDNQISRLIECLPHLLVLDNAESILRGECAGYYWEGYEGYGATKMRRRSTPSKLSSWQVKTQRIGIPRRRNITRSLIKTGLKKVEGRQLFKQRVFLRLRSRMENPDWTLWG